jgi:hypothetical protein
MFKSKTFSKLERTSDLSLASRLVSNTFLGLAKVYKARLESNQGS